jgi:hypothetical protein
VNQYKVNLFVNLLDYDEVKKRLNNQSLLTQSLYFNAHAISTFMSNPIDYHAFKNTFYVRKDEDAEFGRSIKFLVDIGLVSWQPEGVGHG